MRPVIALLTDFGTGDHYAGTMKGVILGICPDATLVDITHDIPPHDVTAITTSIGGTQNGVAAYDVIVHCGEKKFTAAKYVQSKRDAEMVAARLRRAIGIIPA